MFCQRVKKNTTGGKLTGEKKFNLFYLYYLFYLIWS